MKDSLTLGKPRIEHAEPFWETCVFNSSFSTPEPLPPLVWYCRMTGSHLLNLQDLCPSVHQSTCLYIYIHRNEQLMDGLLHQPLWNNSGARTPRRTMKILPLPHIFWNWCCYQLKWDEMMRWDTVYYIVPHGEMCNSPHQRLKYRQTIHNSSIV